MPASWFTFKCLERTEDAVVGEKVSTEKPQSKPKQVPKSPIRQKPRQQGRKLRYRASKATGEPIKPAVESKEVEAAKPTGSRTKAIDQHPGRPLGCLFSCTTESHQDLFLAPKTTKTPSSQ